MSAPRLRLAMGFARVPALLGLPAADDGLARVFELRSAGPQGMVVCAVETARKLDAKAARKALVARATRLCAEHGAARVQLFLYPQGSAPEALPPVALAGSRAAARWAMHDPEAAGWLWSLTLDGATGAASLTAAGGAAHGA